MSDIITTTTPPALPPRPPPPTPPRPDTPSTQRSAQSSSAPGNDANSASGIVTVVSHTRNKQFNVVGDHEMDFLTKIPRFEPLIRTSVDTAFNWGGLFSGSSTVKKRDPSLSLDSAPLEDVLTRIRKHTKTCVDAVVSDQKSLSERINSMDEYCAKLANTIAGRVYQARAHVDALSKLTSINKQAENTRALLTGVVALLERLDSVLAPGERLDNADNKKRYPAIVKMRAKLLQSGGLGSGGSSPISGDVGHG